MLITQNIDDLHQTAGSGNIVELHGNIFKNYCITCGMRYDERDLPEQVSEIWLCECGGFVRPDVVWFGELLPAEEFQKAEQFCRRCDILLSVGTSGVVHPAAGLPLTAREGGAFIVEVNPEPTEISSMADVVFRQNAGTILPLIVDRLA